MPKDLRDARELENDVCNVFSPGWAGPFIFGGVSVKALIGGGKPMFCKIALFAVKFCDVWNEELGFEAVVEIDMSAGVPKENGCGALSFQAR